MPIGGSGLWFGEQTVINIPVANLAASEMIDPNSARLEFSVAVIGDRPPTSPALPTTAVDVALPMRSAADAAICFPGAVNFGTAGVFESVSCKIPALSYASYIQSDADAQLTAKRLMCSGVASAHIDRVQGVAGYQIGGRAFAAGAMDAATRSLPVWAQLINTDRGSETVPPTVLQEENLVGSLLHFSVPMSQYSTLFHAPSGMLPLSLLSSGGTLMEALFKVGSASSAINQISVDKSDIAPAFKMWIIDPKISCTVVSVLNVDIMQSLIQLFNGQSKLLISPGMPEVSAAMIYKTLNIYASARQEIVGATGRFNISLPLNVPSLRGIMVTFDSVDQTNMGLFSGTGATPAARSTRHTMRHALSLKPLLAGFGAKIGSMHIPIENLQDQVYVDGQYPVPGGNPFPSTWANRSVPLHCKTTDRAAIRFYQKGKSLFSPFGTDEDFAEDALSCLNAVQYSGVQTSNGASPPVITNTLNNDARFFYGTTLERVVLGTTPSDLKPVSGTSEASRRVRADLMGPNLFVLPLESLSPMTNQLDDAFALRGLDVRNLSSLTVSGQILGVQNSTPSSHSDLQVNPVSTSGWVISVYGICDAMLSILRARCDPASEFSLIPV